MTVHRNYVAGEWRDGATARVNDDPSDLDAPVGVFAEGTADDVRDAAAAAREAAPAWAAVPAGERADLLHAVALELAARREELGELLSREEGKTRAEGVAEVGRAADLFRFYAAEAFRVGGELLPSARRGVAIEVHRRPVGVVGVITPWNFPIAIPAWKIAPALAYGNCVVFKPAELTPACAWELTACLDRAGFPPGVFNLVMGRGEEVGAAITACPDVDAVTFTGSTDVGRRVAAATAVRFAKAQLEMGGKNALVVLDDADLDLAAAHAASGAFASTGQRCTASSRLIVTDAIHDDFVARLAARTRALRVGPALDPVTDVGPVVDAAQLERDLAYLRIGVQEGARHLLGGELVTRGTRGHFLTPALFVGSTASMRINREEVFGPVAAVIRVADYEEALAVTNDSDYGLVAGIMTGSLRHAEHFKRHAQVGMTMVNLPTAGQEYQAPFGGLKGSSYGPREQGAQAREFFTTTTTAYVNHSAG